ncbi:MAG: hypothetical protein M0P73_08280 [Syntrophobacterales bacterium]|nr:hypothetical protein [Syntrophobacterales bacterium]
MHSHPLSLRIGILVSVLTLALWWPAGLPVPLAGPAASLAQETAASGEVVQGYAGVSIEAISNISGNYVVETNTVYNSSIMDSFRGFQGLAASNQAAGNLNNQGTYVGFAITGNNNALLSTDVNFATKHENNSLMTNNTFYQATIGGQAFKGGTGIALVNQVSGNMNTQLKAVTVSMGNGAAILNNSQLSNVNINNDLQVQGPMTAKVSLDEGAFQDFKGVASVTQVAGNLNQVATSLRINVNFLP